jgi:hypothetical protein
MSGIDYREPSLPRDVGEWCEFSNDKDFEEYLVAQLRGYVLADDMLPPGNGPWLSVQGGCHWHCRIKVESPQS